MKRIALLSLLILLLVLPAAAQDYDQFEAAFATFATEAANSLPFNALIGQNWSTAYIGGFPHLGAGLTLGATTLPYTAAEPVVKMFSVSLPTELAFLEDYGMPIPAYTLDARLGIPLLPMDAGIKFGFLPADAQALLPANLSLDYLLAGADVRYAIFKGKGLMPALSVGAGISYLRGSFAMDGLFGSDQEITNINGGIVSLSDPALSFNWDTTVIDIKAQVSKSILFLEPFAGVGVAYGASTAGGGLKADVLYNGSPISQSDIDAINTAMGENAPDLNSKGILVSSKAGGWAVRGFGGVSFKLLFLYMDVLGMYNLTSGAYGASLNLRLQF